jgi:hypothetical protein
MAFAAVRRSTALRASAATTIDRAAAVQIGTRNSSSGIDGDQQLIERLGFASLRRRT